MNSDKQPELSIVIPYFNQPEQLAQVLEDLLRQEGVELEVFVVDDASERSCCGCVADFQKRGLDVVLIRQSQRSYTLAARLRGMKEARGRWLAFMDSDDGLCSSTAYAQAVQAADAAKTDILHFVTLVDDGGGRLCTWNNATPFHAVSLSGETIFRTWLATDCHAHSVWNKLYSRTLYQKLLNIPHTLPIFRIEDFYLTAHFLLLAQRYIPSDIPVYRYIPPSGMHLEKAAARAVDSMRMYLSLPNHLKELGLPHSDSEKLKKYLRMQTTFNAGRMCRLLPCRTEGYAIFDDIEPDALQRILRYGSMKDFFLVLAIANASNAQKLKDIIQKFS